jgi:hypothetical protein
MATVVQTMQFNTGVSASGSRSSPGSTTIYTAPADTMAIVNVHFSCYCPSSPGGGGFPAGDTSATLSISGQTVYSISTGGTSLSGSYDNGASVYLGPGQSISISTGSSGFIISGATASCAVYGVTFVNK